MANDEPKASADGVEAGDLAKAFQELARGERTATALENQLSTMEAKIEALLAQAEREQAQIQSTKRANTEEDEGSVTEAKSDG